MCFATVASRCPRHSSLPLASCRQRCGDFIWVAMAGRWVVCALWGGPGRGQPGVALSPRRQHASLPPFLRTSTQLFSFFAFYSLVLFRPLLVKLRPCSLVKPGRAYVRPGRWWPMWVCCHDFSFQKHILHHSLSARTAASLATGLAWCYPVSLLLIAITYFIPPTALDIHLILNWCLIFPVHLISYYTLFNLIIF